MKWMRPMIVESFSWLLGASVAVGQAFEERPDIAAACDTAAAQFVNESTDSVWVHAGTTLLATCPTKGVPAVVQQWTDPPVTSRLELLIAVSISLPDQRSFQVVYPLAASPTTERSLRFAAITVLYTFAVPGKVVWIDQVPQSWPPSKPFIKFGEPGVDPEPGAFPLDPTVTTQVRQLFENIQDTEQDQLMPVLMGRMLMRIRAWENRLPPGG